MSYQGMFIARIPNDEHAQSKIDEFKKQHGQLRLCGRHKDRKGQMAMVGRKLNTHGDLPWRLGSEIVIYRGEDGMTFKQFQDLRVGDLVKPYHIGYVGRMGKVGVVVEKYGKNRLKVAWGNHTKWTTRQKVLSLEQEIQ